MIHVVRVEGHGESPGDLHKEIEGSINTLWEIARLEGSAPSCMSIKGEVYPRRKAEETQDIGGLEFGYEFDGRKVVEFSFLEKDYPLEPKLQRDLEGNPDFVVYRRLPNGEQVEVTDAVIVVRRQNTQWFEDSAMTHPEMGPDPFGHTKEQIQALREADKQWWEQPEKYFGPGAVPQSVQMKSVFTVGGVNATAPGMASGGWAPVNVAGSNG